MTMHRNTGSQETTATGVTWWGEATAGKAWLGEPGRVVGERLVTGHALRSALEWVSSLHGVDELSAEEQQKFAADYVAAMDEIPVNLDPDRTLPTPADFADENWADYWSWPLAGSTSA